MTESRPMPVRIDLSRADDPRDVVHRAVACLAQGGVVALPTDTAYGLAAIALHPGAVARLSAIKGGGEGRPLPLALKGADEVKDWAPELSPVGLRLARRAWPGALTLIVAGGVARGLARRLAEEVRGIVAPNETIGLRVPSHPALRELLRLVPGPLVLTGSKAASGEALASSPGPDMVLDAGPTPEAGPSTVVRIAGESWEVLRVGAVPTDDLMRMAGTIILFVCTGNTCRSPMAEALCRALIAARLGCPPEQVEARGVVVLSAGVGAMEGMPAASHAVEVVKARGGSLHQHTSRRVSAELVGQADLIVAMTRDHRDALLSYLPEAAGRVRLLDPTGADIEDPIGADRDTYRRTADSIISHLDHLLNGLGIGSPGGH